MPLVLERKIDEAILIGQDIRVVVAGIRGGRVTLAITAPRELEISRCDTVRVAKETVEQMSDLQNRVQDERPAEISDGTWQREIWSNGVEFFTKEVDGRFLMWTYDLDGKWSFSAGEQ